MTDRVYGFQWTEGFSSPVRAEVVAQELGRIEAEQGPVTPRLVVDAARSKTSPLHPLFEWNNRKAADQWRLYRAQQTISSLRVIVREGDAPVPARAYVKVEQGGDRQHRAFLPITSVADDPRRRAAFLLGELRNVRGCLERTAAFPEMEPLREALALVEQGLAEERALTASAAD